MKHLLAHEKKWLPVYALIGLIVGVMTTGL